MANLVKTFAFLLGIVFLVLLVIGAAQGQNVPAFPQRTAEGLYQQLGSCTADLYDSRQWAQVLVSELQKKDKEITELKIELAKQQHTPD